MEIKCAYKKQQKKEMHVKQFLCAFALFCISLDYAAAAAVGSTVAPTLQMAKNLPDNNINTRDAEGILTAMCPKMLSQVFEGAAPHDNMAAGAFKVYRPKEMPESSGAVDLNSCVAGCCAANKNQTDNSHKKENSTTSCHVAFIFKQSCYHVHCLNNEGCLPLERSGYKESLKMVLVQPVLEHDENLTWLKVLRDSKAKNQAQQLDSLDEFLYKSGNSQVESNEHYSGKPGLSFWNQRRKLDFNRNQELPLSYEDEFPLADKRAKKIFMPPMQETPDQLAYYRSNLGTETNEQMTWRACNIELTDLIGRLCGPHEQCVHEVCKCVHGYVHNELRECVPSNENDYSQIMDMNASEMLSAAVNDEEVPTQQQQQQQQQQTTTLQQEKSIVKKNFQVSVSSKVVRLPEQEVTLTANTQPSETESGMKYKYLWTLVTQPKGPINGTITDQSESTVRLSNLSEGLYIFKVSVSSTDGVTGEAEANVTVLPLKRLNSAPVAVITPKEQAIRQPTTNAVLDGSTSSDDAKIVSWHWEVVQAPLGYQPQLPEINTLQLTDLNVPGNYTFKLTVMDSDNVTNSTTANIKVLKGTDYPPVANAGDGVILYLPNNNVTLNGTASSDDHAIVAWEWTKDASDEAKAVDMQKTRTPYLQLSNLEEGMYTFVLKVTDGSNQSSMAKVHVFVKPPSNSPPKAKAGQNSTISLPQNWASLNGSESTDDIKIVKYSWKQLTGPKSATILMSNSSIANATALTLGLYKFELSVTDENNNTAVDNTWIKVVQEKNAPPVANAGEDLAVTLPLSALYLNGSRSTDDLAVVKYQWTRDGTSLAAGCIIDDTDTKPVLILTNLVHGRYVFKLTVSDEQGLTSTDTVTVIVRPDPLLMNLVELTLPLAALDLTQAELDTIAQKIGLLLGDMKIHIRDLKYDSKSQATILVFYAEEVDEHGNSNVVDGLYVEQMLKDKLLRDAKILGTVFADVRTTVCQNKCSDHGVCNAITRACLCEAFWMPSVAYLLGLEEANCDWSILYVFVGVLMFLVLISSIFWGISLTFCQKKRKPVTKKPRSRPKVQKYSLIGTQDEEAPHFGRTTSLTDSETDSDVLFETRTKPNGILRNTGANKRHSHSSGKYSNTKLSRKIKA